VTFGLFGFTIFFISVAAFFVWLVVWLFLLFFSLFFRLSHHFTVM